ncbi:1-hydroxy-2-methyl-2-butenyl 4-diphosphate reductase [Streptomyces sp. FH025]|uniref:5'-methylthioadenosine/S-adenosylhomocysteine nucleosidase family protein n=1 Tax=Streptomyces sp. FH025 TaxID=2815937 RepID=UPI001A9E1CC2|nr:1-hydroxy-2-methyl-2-butenyl 4-diphosphate reductase [Streptomyces sp. FH025]MBO1414687.1 1-hydroxy-2-methyl-2-butenyl 4-diphosphate reductase [Streptomyces sp. FH025]
MTTAPLLVLCALGPEVWALRGGDWRGSVGGSPVLVRTGVGRRRAGLAVRRLLSSAPQGYGAVVVAGFGAAVGPGVAPGDVVAADGVRDAEGHLYPVGSGPELARALKEHGLTVHTGVHHTADHVVRGLERRALHLQGALAVDMEAAAVVAALREVRPALPVGVLRVVVDTPEHELLRLGTLPAGVRAWRTLRATVPALVDWYRQELESGSVTLNHPTSSTLPQEAS